MDYRFDDKGKVKEEFTPARRWSFLVGKNENSHTAKSQLVPIIEDDEHNPTLARLEEAFNIEIVTKEFFGEYRELFLRTKERLDTLISENSKVRVDFESKSVNTVDFAKKLLGQIVFLYFLQKKGWFGVKRDAGWGTGPKNFLRELFEGKHGSYSNFFNDILEPLFYEALSRERDDNFYSRFNCKIPFLNGGLFDPIGGYDWVHTDIFLTNELFSNNTKTKEGDTGNGILDIFDRYNFTVKEDEPLEKEVAVDPEMLGKVFENLLEVKDRKSKGTYYTPREIVHYMCQQSLINYLATELEGKVAKDDIETLIKCGEQVGENEATVEAKGRETDTYFYKLPESIRQNAKLIDDKLANIKVCDPAIGSGAFPVGMMGEITKARNVLSAFIKEPNRTIYLFKRECIEKSLYGVDIDPGAVEIAKLRLWLSLVVDEEDYHTIKPLPNLDYKIVCGNSLIGVKEDLFNQPLFEELERLKPLLFNETSSSKKQEYKKQIEDLISQITKGHKEFDFKVYFSEVFHEKGGFDVVIANPPYGSEMGEKELEKIKRNLKNTKNTNSAAVFIDYGINRLVNPKGTLTFIVPKSLLFAEKWFDLVKVMIGKVSILVDVEKAFENVKLEQVVFLYGKTIKTNSYLARKFLDNEFIRTTTILNELVVKYSAWICDVSKEEMRIAEKATSKPITYMREISKTKRGMPLQSFLTSEGEYAVIGGKNIFRYGINGEKGFLPLTNIMQNQRKSAFLIQPKIVSQNIVAHIQNPTPRIMIMAAMDPFGRVFSVDTVNNTVLITKEYDLRYILALMNCRFTSWFAYRFIYCSAIRTMHFDNYYVGKIPVVRLAKDKQEPFIDLVDKILAITKDDDYLQNEAKQSKVKEYSRQIDQLVYNLYGLTEEEIAIVEGKNL